jgi:hypothetical protein
MEKVDLIIGCTTNYDWPKLKYWVNSINKSGFKGDKMLVMMNADAQTVQEVKNAGFGIIGFGNDDKGNLVYSSKMMVHVERFIHIYNYINPERHRYVITTDVKDVVFQKNPFEFLENNLGDKNLVFASESIRYKDEPWGNENLMQTFGRFVYDRFKDNEIYNVGVLGGKAEAMKDLCLNIFVSCLNKPISICDQSTFNFLISQQPYKDTSLYMKSEDGWACQLGTTADPQKIDAFKPFLLEESPKMSKGIVQTSTGKEYYIVHQYDRIPVWKRLIESRFA